MSVKRPGLGRGLEALLGTTEVVETIKEKTSDNNLQFIPVDKIKRGQYQPRVYFEAEALQALADSIKSQGILQPIVIRPIGDQYELIAGERRWRAAQLAQLHEIPAIIRRDLPNEAVAAVALIENIQRENLNPLEEARAFDRLIKEFEMTHQQVADVVSRSRAAVTNLLRLLDLNEEVKKLVEHNKIDMGHARALLALSASKQLGLAHQIIAKDLSVRQTENLVRHELSAKSSAKTSSKRDPDIQRLEQNLSDQLGAKVTIQHSAKGNGRMIINYTSSDELQGILKKIKS